MLLHQADAKKMGFIKKIIILALAALIAFVGFAVAKKAWSKYKLEKEIQELQSQIANLEKGNRELEGLIGYLSTDDFLEREARARLNLKKTGEKVAILALLEKKEEIAGGQGDADLALSPKDRVKEKSGWAANAWRWWEYFFEN